MKMSGKVKETEGEVRVRPRCVGSGTGVVLWLPFFFFFSERLVFYCFLYLFIRCHSG